MLGNIFNVFSKREKQEYNDLKPISETFRNRYFMLLKDFFYPSTVEVLTELHKKLCYLHGKHQLTDNSNQTIKPVEDVANFLFSCKDEHLLDSIEYLFQIKSFQQIHYKEGFSNQINEFFSIDKLPYYLTKTVWKEIDSSLTETYRNTKQIQEYPKIIRKDSEIIHNLAVEPVLALLRKPDLLNANEEFMLALQDYRKGDYKDSVSKCCSALESVMKVICKRHKYKYNDKQTASPLLKTIINKSQLDTFWEQPIILIATIRNRLSYSHGAGNQNKTVPEHVAKYSINATASAILLLYDEAY